MKTLYRVDLEDRDMEGRFRGWQIGTEYDTLEAIEAKAAKIKGKDDWRIMKRTIDEATFMVEDEMVKYFDYWKEVGRYETAKFRIEMYTESLRDWEKKLGRAKSESGKIRCENGIAACKEAIAKEEALLANKK